MKVSHEPFMLTISSPRVPPWRWIFLPRMASI